MIEVRIVFNGREKQSNIKVSRLNFSTDSYFHAAMLIEPYASLNFIKSCSILFDNGTRSITYDHLCKVLAKLDIDADVNDSEFFNEVSTIKKRYFDKALIKEGLGEWKQ